MINYQLALLVKSIGEAAEEEQQVSVAPLDLQGFTKRVRLFTRSTLMTFLTSLLRSIFNLVIMEKEEPSTLLMLRWDSWGLKTLSTELDPSTL
ncbi:hypothetical protein M0R45_035122 [Rubus argutus]|uniref:Uncharacterized protein n=1 Tax=Rubus argutus TaxID=59490 RepID=A0AAW1VVW9_RUBAR